MGAKRLKAGAQSAASVPSLILASRVRSVLWEAEAIESNV